MQKGAIAFGVLVVIIGLGLVAAAVSGQSRGPLRPADMWPLDGWVRAAELNGAIRRAGSAFELPGALLALERVEGESAAVRFKYDDGARAGHVLRCQSDDLDALARAYGDYARNKDPAPFCWAATGSRLTIFEVKSELRTICPAHYGSLGEAQVHHGLFAPLVHESAQAVMERPDGGKLGLCDGNDYSNCFVIENNPFYYCGRIREDAHFALEAGSRPVRPDDVAASVYYYAALARAENGTAELNHEGCGSSPTPVFLHGLMREVITKDTFEDHIEAQSLHPMFAHKLERLFTDPVEGGRAVCLVAVGLQEGGGRAQAAAPSQSPKFLHRVFAAPVFAPYDARDPNRVSPIFARLHDQVSRSSGARVARALSLDQEWGSPRSDGCDLACRVGKQLELAFGQGSRERARSLGSPARVAPLDLPRHVAGSGQYRITKRTELGYELVGRQGQRLDYLGVWPEDISVAARDCASGQQCIFRGVWSRDWQPDVGRRVGSETEYPSMLGLFGHAEANGACVRELFARMKGAPVTDLVNLQFELARPLGLAVDQKQRWPSSVRELGILSRDVVRSARAPVALRPAGERCRGGVRLGYLEAEPWKEAAGLIRKMTRDAQFSVELVSLNRRSLRGRNSGWDVVLTVAPFYTNRELPTLSSLFNPGAENAFSGRSPLNPSSGAELWHAYEALVTETGSTELGTRRTRLDALLALEENLYAGPAPIMALRFMDPAAFFVGSEHVRDPADPFLLARLDR